MYMCIECGAIFEEPGYEDICLEKEYGVSSLFPDRHWITVAYCPSCHSPIDIMEDFYYEENEYESDE